MNQSISNIYCAIGGFNIKIVLHKPPKGFKIHNLKSYFFEKLRNFLLLSAPKIIDCSIHFVPVEKPELIYIKNERKLFLNIFQKNSENRTTCYYRFSESHMSMVLGDAITSLLVRSGGFIIHASAVVIENKATLFIGRSEAGKSTIMTSLKDMYRPIADDAGIIRKENNAYYFYQAPIIDRFYNWLKIKPQKYALGNIYILDKTNAFNCIKIDNTNTNFQKTILHINDDKKAITDNTRQIMEFIKSYNNFYMLSFMKDSDKIKAFFIKETYPQTKKD
jgi:hypothetical protein